MFVERPETTPLEFVQKTQCTYQELSYITGVGYQGVKQWFMKGKWHREPHVSVLKLLAAELRIRELEERFSGRN